MFPLLQRELSLDAFVGPERKHRWDAYLAEPRTVDPLQRIHEFEVRRAVARALLALDARERYIIQNRFGLLGGEGKTLEQIGRDLGLSRERIRQLEFAAKKTLRAILVLLDKPHTVQVTGTARQTCTPT